MNNIIFRSCCVTPYRTDVQYLSPTHKHSDPTDSHAIVHHMKQLYLYYLFFKLYYL